MSKGRGGQGGRRGGGRQRGQGRGRPGAGQGQRGTTPVRRDGRSERPRGPGGDQVEGRHETFVANTIEEIAAVFPDHELIQSLGCESCLNLPIVVAGQVMGTLNCLHEAGHYTADRVAAADTLKQPGALALLVASALRKGA